MADTKQQFNDFFDRRFKDAKGDDFEKWFVAMASYVWGDDFESIKAGGPYGDKKCDGHKISEEIIFQCYAPADSSTFTKKAANKMADSFPEVIRFWPNMKKWVLVHNNAGDLPAKVHNKLEKLREKYPDIELKTWERECLKAELHDKLSLRQLEDIYPESRGKIEPVKLEHIKPLLDKIIKEAGDSLDFNDFGDTPRPEKIDFNDFSERSKKIIHRGLVQVAIVRDYINNLSKPENADKIQNSMKEKYKELKDYEYSSDELLQELIKWVRIVENDEQRAAAVVIIAYFFESCDIFKNAPVGGSHADAD